MSISLGSQQAFKKMSQFEFQTQNLSQRMANKRSILLPTKLWELENKLIINNFIIIKRKKYSMFSPEIKKRCIEAAFNYDLKSVSKMFSVPWKSWKRWMKVGPDRKKGGGRKIRDPDMEKQLYSWYVQCQNRKINVTPKMIKQKALVLTKYRDFIASKGWWEKFKRKFKLNLCRENKVYEVEKTACMTTDTSLITIKDCTAFNLFQVEKE